MIPVFRCSGLDADFSCNGRIVLVPLMPVRDSSEAHEGTLIHYLIAKKLVEEHGAVPPEGGLVPPVLPKGYKLPAFSAWIVDWAVKLVKDTIPADWALMVEVPVSYEFALPRPLWIPIDQIHGEPSDNATRTLPDGTVEVFVNRFILSGHIDVQGLSPDATESHGLDWKTGPVGADPADNSWQAGGYLGLCKRAWELLNRSRFTLAQPRIDEEATGIQRISTVELSGAQLDAMNTEIAEQVNRALENRMQTSSGLKQCKYCPVSWRCPSIQGDIQLMKATLTKEAIESLRGAPDDGKLGDFVIGARTLKGPLEAAEELLHERLDGTGCVDAASGVRITRKIQKGSYSVPDPVAFMNAVRVVLPQDEQIARVMTPSMTRIKDEIAAHMDIPQTSKHGQSAEAVFNGHLRPLVEQGEKRILVFT